MLRVTLEQWRMFQAVAEAGGFIQAVLAVCIESPKDRGDVETHANHSSVDVCWRPGPP